MPRIAVGLGAGGHAKVVIEALRAAGEVELCGLLDPDPSREGKRVLGVPVLGSDLLLPQLVAQGVDAFFLGVGSVGVADARRRLWDAGHRVGLAPVRVIHPASIVSPSATLGAGVTVLAGAVINAEAQVGDNVIVNSGAIVEHDCRIGDHAHVAPGARLSGNVQVGSGAHIGIGAIVRQGARIGANAVVGAGAVVIRDVAPGATVVGVPARVLRSA